MLNSFLLHSTLASVGAAIILLSLSLDLFFQQIISYPSALVLDSSNATISRAIFYDGSPELIFINQVEKITTDSQLNSFLYPYWHLILSLVFLIATAIRSVKEKDKIGIFKTSALAILFNGLGDEVQAQYGGIQRMGETRARARDMKVKLEDDSMLT